MKKVIVFALLFGVFTGSAFAQLTLSGSFYAGVQIDIPYASDEGRYRENEVQHAVNPLHRREGAPVFNFAATFNRPNGGARLDTSFQADLTGDDPVTLNGIYGWVDFLNNDLRFTLGRISSPLWVASLDPDHEWYFDKITGFRLEYRTPLPGLTVGAAFRTEGGTAAQLFERIIVGANFLHPMFSAVFAYNVGANGHALLGVSFFGIPDLSLGVQLRARNIASWDHPGLGGSFEMVQRAAFRVMRPLEVSLLAGQIFYAEPRGEGFERRDAELFFTPGVSYRIRPDLTASFAVEVRSSDLFDQSRLITLNPALDYQVNDRIAFYAEYELRLARYMHQSFHRIGIGINIRAF